MTTLPKVLQWLAGLMLLLHLPRAFGWDSVAQIIFSHLAFVPLRFQGVEYLAVSPLASILSPIGYSLIHGDWLHLFVNLAMLVAFGKVVVTLFGIRIFILLYILGALAGSSSDLMIAQDAQRPLIGASAAISALIGAITCLGMTQTRPMPRPFDSRIRSRQFLFVWIGINLLFGLIPYAANMAIAWYAHLAGLAVGYIYARFRL